MSVFDHHDYFSYLQNRLKAAKGQWGVITKMAESAGCQRSHLSRVLSGRVHLTLDQADGLCEFWELNEAERDYFITLVEHERASRPAYRKRLSEKLKRMRRAQENIAERLNQGSVGSVETQSIYYSSWYWGAIHVAVSIPDLRTADAIAKRLQLPKAIVESCLKKLEEMGLVHHEGKTWSHVSATLHLPKTSPLIAVHHNNWRQRAVLAAQDPSNEGLHYSIVQSVSRADYDRIKRLLLSMIEDYNKVAGPSKEEELICFACDLFKV